MYSKHIITRWRGLSLASLAAYACLFVPVFDPAESLAGQTRAERCSKLQSQLAEQIEIHAGSSHSATAAAMGAKARKLCASGKQAQGLRTYAKALQILGVQPIDPK